MRGFDGLFRNANDDDPATGFERPVSSDLSRAAFGAQPFLAGKSPSRAKS
jgi:hypothetical protein